MYRIKWYINILLGGVTSAYHSSFSVRATSVFCRYCNRCGHLYWKRDQKYHEYIKSKKQGRLDGALTAFMSGLCFPWERTSGSRQLGRVSFMHVIEAELPVLVVWDMDSLYNSKLVWKNFQNYFSLLNQEFYMSLKFSLLYI